MCIQQWRINTRFYYKMPVLLLAWVICAPAFLKCFKVFSLCEFSGNTHYLPGCHNTVFAGWVTSALVIQKPLFSEQIATENDNGLLQTGKNKTVLLYGLVTRLQDEQKVYVGLKSRFFFLGGGSWGRWRLKETWKGLNVLGEQFFQQSVPHSSIFILATHLESASLGNERLGLELEIYSLV